jgi:hypothetical protein
MSAGYDFILSFITAGLVGAALLFLGTKLLAKIRLPFKDCLWVSFIALTLTSVIGFGLGFFLVNHMGLVLIFNILIALFLQAFVYRIAVGATGQKLSAWKAYILSLTVVLAGFFVSSPIVAWIEGEF